MSLKTVNSTNSDLSTAERQKELDAKRARADNIIGMHVTGAVVIGFTPIPFSDAPTLLANQAMLVDNVINVYESHELSELVNILLCQVGLGFVISQFAIQGTAYLTAQLLKLLPGLGSIAGGLVNGTVAGAITYGYGAAINGFCYNKCKDAIYTNADSVVTDEDIRNFTNVFRQTFDKYSSDANNAQMENGGYDL